MLRDEDDLIDAIARKVEQRLARSGRLQAQKGSPLGPRTHRAAVKRRLENNEGGARIVGERFLLTPDALDEELERETAKQLSQRKRFQRQGDSPGPRRARKGADQSPELDALQRELTGGLRRIGEVR